MQDSSPRGHAIHDVVAVLLLCVLYVASDLCGLPKRYIFCGLGAALCAYGVLVWRRGAESWRDFGLRTDNLARAAIPAAAWTALASAGILLWALLRGESLWRRDLLFLLPLYPVYGIAQQLLFQGVLHRRLAVLLPDAAATVLTAAAFAFVHVGDWRLAGLTLAAGLVWSEIFRRWPNVWVLGISHGILAALTYPLLLGDQPLGRV